MREAPKIQVLEIRDFQNIDLFHTDLREVFGFIRRSGDMKAEKEFTKENEDRFKALDEDAFDVIVAVTGARELGKVKELYREEGVREGLKEGLIEGHKKGQKEKAFTTAKNMYTRGFTAKDTAGLLEESLETVEKWFEEWKAGQG